MKHRYTVLVWLFCLGIPVHGESFRALITGNLEVLRDNPGGVSIPLSYISSVLIGLDQDVRFFRGVELELTAPQTYLDYYGTLAMAIYTNLNTAPGLGTADLEARQILFEPIPNKIQTVYQIPIRPSHGMRSTPYISVPTGVIQPGSFPILFRIMPVVKGLNEEIEGMVFKLQVKPVLSNEGAVKFLLRYPEQLPGKPFIMLIDDVIIEKPGEEQVLREGEHHLVVLSENYRNESRRFLVERGKILDIIVELQDPTAVIFFEAPEKTLIYVDNELLTNTGKPYPIEPGKHEIKFQMSDYAIVRVLTVQKGRTYRVALTIDIGISESE